MTENCMKNCFRLKETKETRQLNAAHDCGYAGIEILPDGTIVTTSYGRFTPGEPNYVVSVRLHPEELDARVKELMHK